MQKLATKMHRETLDGTLESGHSLIIALLATSGHHEEVTERKLRVCNINELQCMASRWGSFGWMIFRERISDSSALLAGIQGELPHQSTIA